MSTRKFTYRYHACALGMGGVLKHPNGATTIIPSLASAVLASTGGEGCSEISNYDRGGVSFSNMRSSVMGYDAAYRTFTTRSDVYITNLNLFGRVKAAILQTSITSTRDVFEETSFEKQSDPDSARFSMQSMIRGLTVDGVEVIPELDLDLWECPTYEQFAARIGGKNTDLYAKRFGIDPKNLKKLLTDKTQPIHGSFVRALRYHPRDAYEPTDGFKLHVKNFGTIHVGELTVERGERRANLLRIEFDSPLAFGDRMPEEPRNAALAPKAASRSSAIAAAEAPYDGGSITAVSPGSNGAPSWP